MKFYTIILSFFLSVALLSCKNGNNSEQVEEESSKTSELEPEWVTQVGSKDFQTKDEIYYVNDYDVIDEGSALTTEDSESN